MNLGKWNGTMWIGVFFVLFGLSIMLKALFKIDLPIFKIALAFFFIYLGVKMLVGNWGFKSSQETFDHSVVFGERDFTWNANVSDGSKAVETFSTVFGQSRIDLTSKPPLSQSRTVEVHTVFGETRVIIDPKVSTSIQVNSVFGEAKMPDGSVVAVGSLNHNTSSAEPVLKIRGNVVFGSIRFISQNDLDAGK